MALPVDPRLPGVYKAQSDDAQSAWEQAMAAAARDQAGLFNRFGFKGNIGETGNSIDIDPNAQYGLIQNVLGSHGDALRGLSAELRGRGLGKVGLAAKRISLLRRLQKGDINDLYNKFGDAASAILQGKAGATSNKNRLMTQYEGDALEWLRNNPMLQAPTQQAAPQTQQSAVNAYSGGGATPPPAFTPNQADAATGNTTPWQSAQTYAGAGYQADPISGPGPVNGGQIDSSMTGSVQSLTQALLNQRRNSKLVNLEYT